MARADQEDLSVLAALRPSPLTGDCHFREAAALKKELETKADMLGEENRDILAMIKGPANSLGQLGRKKLRSFAKSWICE